jgi:hypothetical protein
MSLGWVNGAAAERCTEGYAVRMRGLTHRCRPAGAATWREVAHVRDTKVQPDAAALAEQAELAGQPELAARPLLRVVRR